MSRLIWNCALAGYAGSKLKINTTVAFRAPRAAAAAGRGA
jgi:hypothetical protein